MIYDITIKIICVHLFRMPLSASLFVRVSQPPGPRSMET